MSREKWTIGLAIGRQATLSGEILTFIGRQVTAGSSRSLYMYGVPGIRCSSFETRHLPSHMAPVHNWVHIVSTEVFALFNGGLSAKW